MDAIEVIAWVMVIGGPVGFVVGLMLIVVPMEREWRELTEESEQKCQRCAAQREQHGPLA